MNYEKRENLENNESIFRKNEELNKFLYKRNINNTAKNSIIGYTLIILYFTQRLFFYAF